MFEAKRVSSKTACCFVLVLTFLSGGFANSQSIVDIEADIEKQLQEERDRVITEQKPKSDDELREPESAQPSPAPPCVNYPFCDPGGGI